ncbi:MAG TPA: polymer-forming cytoskeletal protein [Candidatus Acidoferrales bacterium]|jgi:cytoskeletal protein CcmA (bactofilin family)|nr:polymer-forming cytoskeletal protein [Candidatus Acidoferrales bacterium]
MWNKRNDDPTAPQPMPQRYEPATPLPAAVPRPNQPNPTLQPRQTAIIGTSMTIKGEIVSREELLVDGEVDGSMQSQSLLTVGPNGKVRANIKAQEVAIYGSVRGNVEVTGKLSIREQGSLIGDIKCSGISIDDGAYFKGSIDISRPEPKVTTRPVKSEPSVAAAAG